MKPENMTTVHLRKLIGRSPFWRGLLLIALACFAFSPTVRAISPAPDGGYPNFNTAEGTNALFSLTNGDRNTANGFAALYSNTGGFQNTANGAAALQHNTTGNYNTANGALALFYNTTGSENTVNGVDALFYNTTGSENTANGYQALFHNTTGHHNTANGSFSLYLNTGNDNTANGSGALSDNSTGSENTANGYQALGSNRTGSDNTANGAYALFFNRTGYNNTANGVDALLNNRSGRSNTANGFDALYNNTGGSFNTAEGFNALLSNNGSNNIGLGYSAGSSLTTGGGNVCIGSGIFGVAGESNTTRIRNVYSSFASARAVYVNADNKIGTLVSSRRFKNEIKPMDKASEAILALKPVTFRYKKEIEPNGAIMFGLIAEEVEQVDPELVTRNDKGDAETVRYEAVNAMLLNEFLKENRKVEQQDATITQVKSTAAKQEATIAKQQKQVEALTTGLQKVTDQLELSKPAPRTVSNNQ